MNGIHPSATSPVSRTDSSADRGQIDRHLGDRRHVELQRAGRAVDRERDALPAQQRADLTSPSDASGDGAPRTARRAALRRAAPCSRRAPARSVPTTARPASRRAMAIVPALRPHTPRMPVPRRMRRVFTAASAISTVDVVGPRLRQVEAVEAQALGRPPCQLGDDLAAVLERHDADTAIPGRLMAADSPDPRTASTVTVLGLAREAGLQRSAACSILRGLLLPRAATPGAGSRARSSWRPGRTPSFASVPCSWSPPSTPASGRSTCQSLVSLTTTPGQRAADIKQDLFLLWPAELGRRHRSRTARPDAGARGAGAWLRRERRRTADAGQPRAHAARHRRACPRGRRSRLLRHVHPAGRRRQLRSAPPPTSRSRGTPSLADPAGVTVRHARRLAGW